MRGLHCIQINYVEIEAPIQQHEREIKQGKLHISFKIVTDQNRVGTIKNVGNSNKDANNRWLDMSNIF